MIKRIEVKDYRSCLSTNFDLQPHLSVLIGPNASGKTNILNALILLRKLTQDEFELFHHEEPPTAQCKLKVWFNIDGKTAILTADVHTYTDDNNRDVVVSSRQSWYVKDFTGKAKRISAPLSLVRYAGEKITGSRKMLIYYKRRYIRGRNVLFNDIPENLTKPMSMISSYVSNMRYYSASQFTNPSNCPVSFEIEKEGDRSRGLRLHGHAKFLFEDHLPISCQKPE